MNKTQALWVKDIRTIANQNLQIDPNPRISRYINEYKYKYKDMYIYIYLLLITTN